MKVFIELDIQTFKHDQSHITRADEYFASVIKKISETGKGVKIVRINAVDEHMNGDGSISQIAEIPLSAGLLARNPVFHLPISSDTVAYFKNRGFAFLQ